MTFIVLKLMLPCTMTANEHDDDDEDDVDMQIVADSFRVVSDVAAWDSLMHASEEKLARAGLGDNFLSGEQRLKNHYSVIRTLLDKVGVPVVDDPVERAVASVGEPAMVLSENFRVIAINPAGRNAFGIEQGQVAHLDWLSGAWHGQFRALVATPRLRQTDIRVSLAKLKIPFHWVLGLEKVYASPQNQQGFYDQSDLDEVVALNPLISFEGLPDSGELLPYQQPVPAALRIAKSAKGNFNNAAL